MSDPERRQVRVRRSPRVGVFLGLGALIGVLAAVLAAVLLPADPQYPTGQVLGFLALILAAVGAALGGLVAIALDAAASRRTRVLDAERVARVAPPADAGAEAIPETEPASETEVQAGPEASDRP